MLRASTHTSGWQGVVLLAITYVYFLIFAQFAFLKRLVTLGVGGGHRQAITFYDQVALGSLTSPRAPDFVAPFLAFT